MTYIKNPNFQHRPYHRVSATISNKGLNSVGFKYIQHPRNFSQTSSLHLDRLSSLSRNDPRASIINYYRSPERRTYQNDADNDLDSYLDNYSPSTQEELHQTLVPKINILNQQKGIFDNLCQQQQINPSLDLRYQLDFQAFKVLTFEFDIFQ